MVVVSVRCPGEPPRMQRFERTFTIGTTKDSDVFLGPWHTAIEFSVVLADPDVTIEVERGRQGPTLNGYRVDPDFVHVIHAGDKLNVGDREIEFELVAGSAEEVRRAFREVSIIPDDTELALLQALRRDNDDTMAHEVYADWLDGVGRSCEAELVRLQWLSDDQRVTDPTAFSSEWMSHQPRAVQLRIRDLARLSDPARRALSSRPSMMCPRAATCPGWVELSIDPDSDTRRTCWRCSTAAPFCSTYEDVAARGTVGEPAAIDPILVHERAVQVYREPPEDFEEPTDSGILYDGDLEEL